MLLLPHGYISSRKISTIKMEDAKRSKIDEELSLTSMIPQDILIDIVGRVASASTLDWLHTKLW